MAINPNIALGINTPNLGSELARGVQMGGRLQELRALADQRQRQDQVRNALGSLMTGEGGPEQMNALAQADPATAMQFQQFQQEQSQAQQEQIQNRAAERAVRFTSLGQRNPQLAVSYLQSELQREDLTDQERQSVSENLQRIQQEGLEPVLQETQAELEAFERTGAIESGPSEPAAVREYQFARQQGFEGSFQDWKEQQRGGMALSVGPDGGVSFTQGGAGIKPIGGSESTGLRDAEVATRNFVNTAGDALTLLQENPDINTFTGKAAGIVNDLQQEAGAFARGMGLEFDEGILDPSNHEESFDNLGIENARMRSLVTSLAFQAAAASGQTGRSVSDRDIRRFIEEIGAASADPRAFSQVLNDLAGRTVRNFKTNLEVRTGRQVDSDLGVGELPQFQEPQEQGGQQEGPLYDDETESLIQKYTEGQ